MEAHEQAAEMAVLAQSKFNETRQHLQSLKNCGRGGGKVAGSKYKYIKQQQKEKPNVNVSEPDDKAQELVSTLLYLSTMLDKVDGMKAMLKDHNVALYEEWRPLFDALSSPATTLREQSNQKERIKRLEKRKNHYKEEAAKTKAEAAKVQEGVQKSEEQLKERISTMSNTIAKLEGRLAEKEDTIESLVNTQSIEKARLEDELMESKKGCETVREELRDLEVKLEEAQVENRESRAATKERDVVIEELRTESNAKSKSIEVLQNELGKVTELEHTLQQKLNEISFFRAKLEASDRHQEELAKIIAKQQQQQQQDLEEPTVSAARVGDDESVASDRSRLEVARAKRESESEALEAELPLGSQQDDEDAVEVTTKEHGSVYTSSASAIDIKISSNLDPDEEVPEDSATDIATISSSAVDCNDESQAATTSILTSTVDEAQEHTTTITENDTRGVCDEPLSTAQKIVDDAVEEAVNSCT